MRNSISSVFFSLLLLLAGLYSNRIAACATNDPSSPVGITPTLVEGNTPDETATNVKFDPPTPGTYPLGTGSVTFSISDGPCGEIMTWTVSDNIVIEHVYAKGGPEYNDYDYTGTTPRPGTDGNLHCPLAGNSGMYADFSHINFVFHYRLTASKTATASYTRDYNWIIDKQCNGPASLMLSEGQSYNYPFSWKADATSTDSDWKVVGTITIYNNTPFSASILSVQDVLSGGIAAEVDCGFDNPFVPPYILGAGATLTCTYSADLDGPANGTNTVTVTTPVNATVEGDIATADYTFGSPTQLEDECITVSDDCKEPTTVCVNNGAPTSFSFSSGTYNCQIGPYNECGEYTYINTASFLSNDNGETGSSSCTVSVNIPCGGGCTLTQGYWKTHSEFGPAPYDATWALLPSGASTVFFLSGKTYYQVLWTPPAGNAYYVLAHQYIAAQLNQLNEASIPAAVLAAYNSATALFNTYTPAQVATFKGPAKNNVTSLASILDNYNNGITGPGHCSEDGGAAGLQSMPNSLITNNESGEVLFLYPNPASTEVQLNLTDFIGQSAQLEVYNQLGAVVLSKNLSLVETPAFTLQLDQSIFVSGIYNVTVRSNNLRKVQKLVVKTQ